MPTLYSHEIASYRIELKKIETDIKNFNSNKIENLTHESFSISNRSNLFVVGLCGLVEARMYEISKSYQGIFRLSDIRGKGISRLKRYLKRTQQIDFANLKNWDAFQSIYKIRNSIVHSYGGMIEDDEISKLNKHMNKLSLDNYLIDGRRIRLGTKALKQILDVVDGLLEELDAYTI